VAQKAVDFIRYNEFFVRQMSRIESARKIDRLLERHVAIIVALDEQHASGEDSQADFMAASRSPFSKRAGALPTQPSSSTDQSCTP